MSNEEDKSKRDGREAERVRWELSEIREELMEELEDLQDEFSDEIEDLREAGEDIKGDLKEELSELKDEELELLSEIGDVKEEIENLEENAQDKIQKAEMRLDHLKTKVRRHEAKYGAKIKKLMEKAKQKAVKRVNISVDSDTSNEWKSWSDQLGKSVSELVRKSMKFVKNNIGDIAKLEEWGQKMESMGVDIEKAVKESGIEDLDEKLKVKFGQDKPGHKIKMAISTGADKERIKKRVSGLVKLHKSVPIEKLAQTINKSNDYAENLIYELVADGIEGSLEEGVFKFTVTPEEVISKLHEFIDNM
ncbi:hypothetical protein LCGC14_0967980 [marine sediment metagenome]|uniref:Uncharacterized protein n=1 Tax=marine sediment metagenome TaxID=412755 RepID=A0A0F9NH01_9ZZZZ|nr:MAG: flagellar assembly protein H [Candidatus Lokiarchaeum sp. GC14_75]